MASTAESTLIGQELRYSMNQATTVACFELRHEMHEAVIERGELSAANSGGPAERR
jgi:hypothetical protein